jgi:hypothetical protein
MFKTLKRIAYRVDDVEKAKEWYATVLGSEPAFDSPVAAIFKIGPCTLSLTKAPSPSLAANSSRIDAYWEVDDVDDAYRRLTELGAIPKAPPRMS